MDKDLYITLLYKSLEGTISASEQQSLESWKAQSTDNQTIAKEIEKAWRLSENFTTTVNADLDKDFANLQQKLNKTTKVVQMKPKRLYLKYAVAAVAAVLIAFFVNYFFNQTPQNWLAVQATTEVEKIELADGSIVWLNQGAKLEYTSEFGRQRLVKLEGEGFFEVTKNPSKPFLVQTPTLEVKVLGTSFNVQESQEEASVFVRSGAVNVRPLSLKKGVDLEPLDKLIFNKATKKLTKMIDSKSNDDVWQSGRLVYENDRLKDIVNGLQNHYGKEFVVDDDTILKCRFTFTFDNKSLQEVLQTLSKVAGFATDERSDYVVLENGVCPEE